MKKVLIIGCPGSGKTTFAKRLAARTHLPLIHLDKTYHKLALAAVDEAVFQEEWRGWLQKEVGKDEWIIDGNHKSSFDIRMPAADTIIFLDYPRWLSVWRVFKRRFQFANKQREDMPEEWKEKISPNFLKFVLSYQKTERPKVLSLLEGYSETKDIRIFKRPDKAEIYLAGLKGI